MHVDITFLETDQTLSMIEVSMRLQQIDSDSETPNDLASFKK